jgi:hypothetical protein
MRRSVITTAYRNRSRSRDIALHIIIGALLGVLILHPITTLVYWYENDDPGGYAPAGAWDFVAARLASAFQVEMMPMSLLFAVIGGGVGLLFGFYHIRLAGERSTIRYLDHELAEELPMLIARGEGEQLEFKSSFRWDTREQRTNRALQQVVVKTIAGFLNHRGGTLLIGVEDDGDIAGIEPDMQTLKHRNQDGFERVLMDAIRTGLGANACALVHCRFHTLEGKTICRVIIEKSHEPIYYLDGGTARFMLRIGNSTRELDAREAHAHLSPRGMRNA